MNETDAIVDFLRELEAQVDDDVNEAVKDYDKYSDYKNGYESGVDDATEEFKERLIKSIRECTECEQMMFHEDDDYLCIFCRNIS